MWLDLPPLFIAKPKQIAPHRLRSESADTANQQPIQPAIILLGFRPSSTQISRSYSNASVLVTGGDSSVVGGLVGFSDVDDVITFSSATGSVSAGNRTAVGGLVGETAGTIIQSFATGNVSGGKTSSAGGLVGV